MLILAGDIGGTNTRLALCERNGQGFRVISEDKFSSAGYSGLEVIIENFFDGKSTDVERACFGIPGAVTGEIIELPNLPWAIDSNSIRQRFGIKELGLINDLEANAYGLCELEEKDFAVLNEGIKSPTGNAAIISAGTGLGEAGMHFEEAMKIRHPFASEGGHTDFAPRNELEIELLRYLLAKFERVSVERVLSGQGLQNIYEFLRDSGRISAPDWLADEILKADDIPAIISRHGLAGNSEICVVALNIFVSIYGAEAGNLALKMLATGGVFLGGGIAPKILPKLKETAFMNSFRAKGRMSQLLEMIPVRVVLNDKAALLGAAHFAFYQMEN
jgi:glucokinase